MNEKKYSVALIAVAFFWSLKGVLYKSIDWSPAAICAVRDLVAFVVYGLYRKSFKLKINRNIVIGALLSMSSNMLFTYANKLTLAANAIVLNYTNTAVIVLITWLILRERISRREILSALLVVFGVVVFFCGSISGGHIVGDLIALLSGILIGIKTVFDNKTPELPTEHYMLACLMSMAIGLPDIITSPPEFTFNEIAAVLVLAVFAVAVPGILYAITIKKVNHVKAGIILTLDPILNALIVAFVIGEIPELLSIIGGLIVVASVGVVCIPEKRYILMNDWRKKT